MAAQSYQYSPVGFAENLKSESYERMGASDSGHNTSSMEYLHRHSFDHRSHQWRLFCKHILWRFACAVLFSSLLLVLLHAFAEKGNLSDWDRRWFNTFAILFSSLVSLSMGSLLGLLGSMFRWRLLARKSHSPRDVDLLLGIHNPVGSFRLVLHHIKRRRWTMTTTMVALYLVLNVAGRLSVAFFGLTFDLNEALEIEYPIKITNWSGPDWFSVRKDQLVGTFGDYDFFDPNFRRFDEYGLIGLVTVDTQYNITDPASYNRANMSGQGLDRKVEGDKVTYSYALKEYRGLDEYPSADTVIQSTSSCIGRALYGSDIYENGKKVGSLLDRTVNSPNFVNILDGIYTYWGETGDYLWAARLDYDHFDDPSACATTYLYTEQGFKDSKDRNATYYECTTCLSTPNHGPGLGSALHALPTQNASYAAGLLLRYPVFERVYAFYSIDEASRDGLGIRQYSGMDKTMHFMNRLGRILPPDNGSPRLTVPHETELYAAHLAARAPVLSLIGAERELRKDPLEPGASERPLVRTALEVKWQRAITVLATIVGGQVLAVGVVVWACWGLFVPDHESFLCLARLLKTAMANVEGRTTDDGKELAKYLARPHDGQAVKTMLRYGSRYRKDGMLELDIWDDVDNCFPEGSYR